MQKGFVPIFLLIGILILAVLGGAYFLGKLPIKPSGDSQKACTQEAKLCPDGSSVGRSGPNCEFAPCPSAAPKQSDETVYTEASRSANWQTYTNQKDAISFQYPKSWRLTVKENSFTGYDEITVAKMIQTPIPDQPNKTIESIEEEFNIYPVKDEGKPQFNNWQPTTQEIIDNIKCEGSESEGSSQQPPSKFYECITNGINFGIALIAIRSDYSTLYQILSTFKFLDSEVVCPADAKQCPDGSWVVRTSPNCKFAPCP